MDKETVASDFHFYYEKLAPNHGYKTREATAVPWTEVPASNRALMLEVAHNVLKDNLFILFEHIDHPLKVYRGGENSIYINCLECAKTLLTVSRE